MIRLFVALGLPDTLCDELSALAGGIPGARWVPEENYHLTLRFIGEVPKWQAQEVDEALAGIRAPGFDLTLRGVGTFEKNGRASRALGRAWRRRSRWSSSRPRWRRRCSASGWSRSAGASRRT